MSDAGSMPKVTAPWSADQVASLNAYQVSGFFHEFTCGSPDCPAILIATGNGWECPAGCGYARDWAYAVMADWSWRTGGIGTALSRFGVSVADGPPLAGKIVTVEAESACCGTEAAWRGIGMRPPWTCMSCGRPCEVKTSRPPQARP